MATITKKKSGLGRGLGALIPQGGATAVATKPTPKNNTSSVSAETTKQSYATTSKETEVEIVSIGGVFELSLTKVKANIDQPRTAFDHRAMEELAESVREHGILQPLAVSPLGDGNYELIAGERRMRAAKLVGLEKVPVFVRAVEGESNKLILGLIENIQREDLNPVEEARAFSKLTDEFGLTQEAVSKQVGKARSTVANSIRLLELPEDMLNAVATGKISSGNARALLAIADEKTRKKLFKKMLAGKVNVRQAEETARNSTGSKTRKDTAILAIEESLRVKFGTKVSVTNSKGRGKVCIEFFSDEEYKNLVEKLLQ